jgi:hypothetical protein
MWLLEWIPDILVGKWGGGMWAVACRWESGLFAAGEVGPFPEPSFGGGRKCVPDMYLLVGWRGMSAYQIH